MCSVRIRERVRSRSYKIRRQTYLCTTCVTQNDKKINKTRNLLMSRYILLLHYMYIFQSTIPCALTDVLVAHKFHATKYWAHKGIRAFYDMTCWMRSLSVRACSNHLWRRREWWIFYLNGDCIIIYEFGVRNIYLMSIWQTLLQRFISIYSIIPLIWSDSYDE